MGQDTKSVKVTASAFNDKWYGLTVNGQAVSDSKALEIPLTGSDTEILFQMKKMGLIRIRHIRHCPILPRVLIKLRSIRNRK